jgi:Family of unknown function (DUF5330)
MGLIRSAVVIGAVVAIMPSDKAQQARLFENAANAAHWTLTFCARNPDACERGAELWGSFREKADFAVRVAYDVASQAMATSSKGEPGPAAGPVRLDAEPRAVDRGTLSGRDLQPAWRGTRAVSAPRQGA